jgi:hypothetical protein
MLITYTDSPNKYFLVSELVEIEEIQGGLLIKSPVIVRAVPKRLLQSFALWILRKLPL